MAYTLQESLGTPAGIGTNVANTAARLWIATQWQANAAYTLTQVELSLRNTTNYTGTLTAKVWSDSGANHPSANTVATSLNTVNGANIANTFANYAFTFTGVSIANGSVYWCGVVANAANANEYAQWQYGGFNVNDQSDQSANGVAWTAFLDRKLIAATYSTAGATLEQEGYRWRNDDGDEANATWAANQDTAITTPPESIRRIRILVNSNGDANAAEFQLEVKEVNEANYTAIA